jgi:hypothetical protein
MDLYETLKEHEVTWDALEAAAVDEYRLLGRPIEGAEVICRHDGMPLFPEAIREPLT